MKILILYHYYHPDDVVSAQHFTGLAEGLIQAATATAQSKIDTVEVWPSNRSCHHPEKTYSCVREIVHEVHIDRIWRPNFSQHSFLGRIFNSLWMQTAWFLKLAFTRSKPDLIILGTDPIFAILLIPCLTWLFRKIKFIHWCFDLYPEAYLVDRFGSENHFLFKLMRPWLKTAYRSCHVLADLGPSMRARLAQYTTLPSSVTLTPWALEEPSAPLDFDLEERRLIFGDTPLALLYSGNFGRAHEFKLTIELARKMRQTAVLGYSIRGSRVEHLKAALQSDDFNIRWVPWAPPHQLAKRLSAPDIHVVSLRSSWSGIVVPSKFFGALAAGRPILFEGSEDSDIAYWIQRYKIGWILNENQIDSIQDQLQSLTPAKKKILFQHCFEVYHSHFSKAKVLQNWNHQVNTLLNTSANSKFSPTFH
jgi:hypothetical protein